MYTTFNAIDSNMYNPKRVFEFFFPLYFCKIPREGLKKFEFIFIIFYLHELKEPPPPPAGEEPNPVDPVFDDPNPVDPKVEPPVPPEKKEKMLKTNDSFSSSYV